MIKALISANVSAGSRSRQRRIPSGIYLTGSQRSQRRSSLVEPPRPAAGQVAAQSV